MINKMKLICSLFLIVALQGFCLASEMQMEHRVEDSTEAPFTHKLKEDEVSSTTESPMQLLKEDAMAKAEVVEAPESTQKYTVADFVIHPLIALKQRTSEDAPAEGKQASTTTTPSPWQIFGFNAGQGLGSSISSVAGWFSDRIPIPGLVETPVRDSTSSTTSTTPKPDIIIQHIGQPPTSRKPIIQINNKNRPNRFNGLPQKFSEDDDDEFNDDEEEEDDDGNYEYDNNVEEDYEEGDDEEDDYYEEQQNNRIKHPQTTDENDEYDEEDADDQDLENDNDSDDNEEEELVEEKPIIKKKKQNLQNQNQKQKPNQNQNQKPNQSQNQKQKPNENQNSNQKQKPNQSQNQKQKTKPKPLNQSSNLNSNRQKKPDPIQNQTPKRPSIQLAPQKYRPITNQKINRKPLIPLVAEESYDDSSEYDNYEDLDQPLQLSSNPLSTKRSQNQPNLLQRGQQTILNQIRQLTQAANRPVVRQGQTVPLRRRRPSAGNYLINRSGPSVVLTPLALPSSQGYYYAPNRPNVHRETGNYPYPPYSVPKRRKNRPTQYITIPWSQLGISAPSQKMTLAEGLQSQPLILNIPASAIENMQNNKPALTAEAVPLLAEASIMDIFKPPKIPPSRTGYKTSKKPSSPKKKPSSSSSVSGSSDTEYMKPQTMASILGQHIRPGTLVEKAPELPGMEEASLGSSNSTTENEYILIGEDTEPGVMRHASGTTINGRHFIPVNSQFEILPNGRLALRRLGRSMNLESESSSAPLATNPSEAKEKPNEAESSPVNSDSSATPL